MKWHFAGKYDGNEENLPHREHIEGYVPFKEVKNVKTFSIIANIVATALAFITFFILFYRGGIDIYADVMIGLILSLATLIPHEFLHGICFKEDVYMYSNLKQGMLFVVGVECMSKVRFIVMSLLPNVVFGFIPFAIFCVNSELAILGALGASAIAAGAGDYINVFNALTQMPKGAYTYLNGFHSFWYTPKELKE